MAKQIEVTLDVWKAIIQLYGSEKSTENDVIKELLDFYEFQKNLLTVTQGSKAGWSRSGVTLPEGSKLRKVLTEKTGYGEKGEMLFAEVRNGTFVVNRKSFGTPTAAAQSITKYGINGWYFWEVMLFGTTEWVSLHGLREQARQNNVK